MRKLFFVLATTLLITVGTAVQLDQLGVRSNQVDPLQKFTDNKPSEGGMHGDNDRKPPPSHHYRDDDEEDEEDEEDEQEEEDVEDEEDERSH